MNFNSLLEEINQLFETVLIDIGHLFPRLVLALFIFLVGLLVAWMVRTLIRRLILYLDRNINERLKGRFLQVDLQRSARFIGKVFYWIIIVFSIAVVSHVLGMAIVNTWFRSLIDYLPNVVAAVIIIFVGLISGRLIRDLIASAASRAGIATGGLLGRLVQYTILFISVIIAIDQIGIDIAFLTNLVAIVLSALLFGAALAFGLGAKTSVSNILGSYYAQKMYREGNKVRIGEIEGVIVRITPAAIIVETKTGKVTIPANLFNSEKTELIKED